MSTGHIPVLLKETMNYLKPKPQKKYLDCTLGLAGHTLAMLEAGAEVTGIDQDQDVLTQASRKIKENGYEKQFTAIHDSFAHALSDGKLAHDYDGILFDLGVSSVQLDSPERGFSFRFDAPLDMRMNPSQQKVTARDLVNGLGRRELYELFQELGDVRSARRLADAICGARRLKEIETTLELAEIVEGVVPRTGHLHPATRVFQALRMAVNSERDELTRALPSALAQLKKNGILAVISFHSGEDKIVKHQFKKWEQDQLASSLSNKPITPSQEEVSRNPRASSAKLRVLRKDKS